MIVGCPLSTGWILTKLGRNDPYSIRPASNLLHIMAEKRFLK